jgi:hypothetical protein
MGRNLIRAKSITAKNIKDALKKARSIYQGNFVVDHVKRKEVKFDVLLKLRKHHRKGK